MPRSRTLLILILLILIAFLSAVAGALAGLIKLPQPVADHPLRTLLLVGAVLGVLGLLLWRVQSPPDVQQVSPVLSQQNRQRMLDTVRTMWITGLLDHSVHHAVLLALRLREQPAAVENPWRLTVQEVNRPPMDLAAGTHITQVFDTAGGKLLILGAPGAGKTTLLLELARDLLARAERDEHYPIPVIFSLSSWASHQSNLVDWFIAEMKLKYSVPEKVGRAWIEHDQLLPLLDGLDEVPEDQRGACVEAINAYQQQEGRGLVPLALTSRQSEYLSGTARVLLHTAVAVQPLTPSQIDAYLSSARGQLEGVRAALHDDSKLQALATTPLMLSVLSLAYLGRSAEDLLEVPLAERQHHIFGVYVERMLERRRRPTRFTPKETMHWLGWLAQQMKQHNQTEFYLERIQPDWLGDAHSRRKYELLVRLVVGLIMGLSVGPFLTLSIVLSSRRPNAQGVGIVVGLFFALLVGLSVGLAAVKNFQIKPAEILVWNWERARQKYTRSVFLRMVGGGMLLAVVVGLLAGPIVGPVVGVLFGLFYGLLFGVVSGWSSDILETKKLFKPNQGIRRSTRHGLSVGIITGSISGLLLGSTVGFGLGLSFGLSIGFVGFLLGGCFFGLVLGGYACIQHFILRLLLRRASCMPWRYVYFLNYATDCILLRKVGGGYGFIHRLLLDYFADLNNTTTSSPLEQPNGA